MGQVCVPAEITDNIMAGVVSLPHGYYGHDRHGVQLGVATKHPRVSANDLTDDQFIDMLSGNAAFNCIAVRLIAQDFRLPARARKGAHSMLCNPVRNTAGGGKDKRAGNFVLRNCPSFAPVLTSVPKSALKRSTGTGIPEA